MKRTRLIAVLAVATLTTVATGSQVAALPGGQSPTWCEKTERGYRCMYGPVVVGADEEVQIMAGSAAPSEAGYITSARATLVDAAGDPIAHHMVHLHHAVWLNPTERDLTCDDYEGVFPNYERFFATGKERTRFRLPDGYGYFWSNQVPQPYTQSSPYWVLIAHLDGMHGSNDTFIQLNLDFTPAERGELTDIRPVWLDVRNCSSDPVFTVHRGSGRNGRFTERWSYQMPVGGRFVFMGGHLHDGGLRLGLRNASDEQSIFTSRALYERPREPWYLTKMTSVVTAEGIAIDAGDRVTLAAVYDSTKRWEDVMGIMVGALVVRD